jgi:hypothetical protein
MCSACVYGEHSRSGCMVNLHKYIYVCKGIPAFPCKPPHIHQYTYASHSIRANNGPPTQAWVGSGMYVVVDLGAEEAMQGRMALDGELSGYVCVCVCVCVCLIYMP